MGCAEGGLLLIEMGWSSSLCRAGSANAGLDRLIITYSNNSTDDPLVFCLYFYGESCGLDPGPWNHCPRQLHHCLGPWISGRGRSDSFWPIPEPLRRKGGCLNVVPTYSTRASTFWNAFVCCSAVCCSRCLNALSLSDNASMAA
jgi:hypothetical protein